MDVKIENFKPIRVAFMRNLGPYQTCHMTWQKMNQWAEERGLCGGGKLVIGVSWDDPQMTPPEKIRYDCCIEVEDIFQADGNVQVMEIKGGEYAVYRHKGSYSELAGAFQRLFREWYPHSGRQFSGNPCLEIYRNNPRNTPVEELVTDLCVPLKPR